MQSRGSAPVRPFYNIARSPMRDRRSRLFRVVAFAAQWALYIGAAILYIAITQLVARAVPDSGFWPGYFGNLFATIAGVALGIPAGLAINRRAESSRREQERKARVQQQLLLVDQTRNSVNDVLSQVESLLHDMGEGHIVPTRLAYRTWIAIAPTVLPQLAEYGHFGKTAADALGPFFTTVEVLQELLDQQIRILFSPSPPRKVRIGPEDRPKQQTSIELMDFVNFTIRSHSEIVLNKGHELTPQLDALHEKIQKSLIERFHFN